MLPIASNQASLIQEIKRWDKKKLNWIEIRNMQLQSSKSLSVAAQGGQIVTKAYVCIPTSLFRADSTFLDSLNE